MKTQELIQLIGEPVHSKVITGKYGNITLHQNGYVSGDPCYFEHAISGTEYRFIRDSIRQSYPWEGYDYKISREQWRPFELGHPCHPAKCFYRDTDGDGTGFFGNGVDSGCVVVIPIDWLPESINTQIKLPQ